MRTCFEAGPMGGLCDWWYPSERAVGVSSPSHSLLPHTWWMVCSNTYAPSLSLTALTNTPPSLPGTSRVRTKYNLLYKLIALDISLSNAKLTTMCSLRWGRQAWARASALSSLSMPRVRDGAKRPLPAADTVPDFSSSRSTSEMNFYSLYAPSLWKFCYNDRP